MKIISHKKVALFMFCAMIVVLVVGCPIMPNTMGVPILHVGSGSLYVSWNPVTNIEFDVLKEYQLRYSEFGSGIWNMLTSEIGTKQNYIITGLTNGTSYEVQVRAASTNGPLGNWSGSAIATPEPKPTAPGTMDAPILKAGNRRLIATWTGPTDNGGSAITGYELRYRTGVGAWTEIEITETSHSISPLTNGASYEVQMRAVNAVDKGPWSASATAMLPSFTTQVPAGTAASSILSNDIDTLVTTENLVVFLTTVGPGTLMVDEVSGVITVTPATAPADVTIPMVNRDTGLITVTAGTTAGTYLVYGKNENEYVRFAEYFFVTESPTTNAELQTAVNTAIGDYNRCQ